LEPIADSQSKRAHRQYRIVQQQSMRYNRQSRMRLYRINNCQNSRSVICYNPFAVRAVPCRPHTFRPSSHKALFVCSLKNDITVARQIDRAKAGDILAAQFREIFSDCRFAIQSDCALASVIFDAERISPFTRTGDDDGVGRLRFLPSSPIVKSLKRRVLESSCRSSPSGEMTG
jgi:hypothetical protein